MDTTTDDMSTDDVRTAELRRDIAQRRDSIGRDLEVIGDRVSPARMADRSKERTRRRITSLRHRFMGSDEIGSGGYDSGQDRSLGERVGDRLSHATADLSDRDPAGAVTGRVEGSPLAMGLVAFGIGFVAGSVFPASRTEEEMAHRLEPRLTQLAEGVGETAMEAGENLAPAVEQETTALRDEAKDAAENLTEKGKKEMAAAREQAT